MDLAGGVAHVVDGADHPHDLDVGPELLQGPLADVVGGAELVQPLGAPAEALDAGDGAEDLVVGEHSRFSRLGGGMSPDIHRVVAVGGWVCDRRASLEWHARY